jgi:rRNA maturation RNase YbeY
MSIDIRNFTKSPAPRASYEAIAKAALPGWEISLVFAGTTRAKSLNQKLRRKSYVPNVLSYESGKKSGEIIICLDIAKKQAKEYGLTYPDFTAYLFIHGLMHLKGHPHGPTMERHERALMSRFVRTSTFNEKTTHSNRH